MTIDSLTTPSMAQAAALSTALDLTFDAIDRPRTPEPGEGHCVACGRVVPVHRDGNRWCSESCAIAEDGPYDDPEPDEEDDEELLREED